jgi:hypothetical protein
MTNPHDPRAEFEGDIPPEEKAAVTRLADRLERDRPVPRAAFRGELRRRLFGTPGERQWRPANLRLHVVAYSSSGVLLLLVAAFGLAGAGPYAAG